MQIIIKQLLQLCSYIKQGWMDFYRDMILSRKCVRRRGEIWLKYDIK